MTSTFLIHGSHLWDSGGSIRQLYKRVLLRRLRRAVSDDDVVAILEPGALDSDFRLRGKLRPLDLVRPEMATEAEERESAYLGAVWFRRADTASIDRDIRLNEIPLLPCTYSIFANRCARQMLLARALQAVAPGAQVVVEPISGVDGIQRSLGELGVRSRRLWPLASHALFSRISPLHGVARRIQFGAPQQRPVLFVPLALSSVSAFGAFAWALKDEDVPVAVLAPPDYLGAIQQSFPPSTVTHQLQVVGASPPDTDLRAILGRLHSYWRDRSFTTLVQSEVSEIARATWAGMVDSGFSIVRGAVVEAADWASTFRSAMDTIRPSVAVVCADHTPRGRALVEVARTAGCPTIRLEGGWIGHQPLTTVVHPAAVERNGSDFAIRWESACDRLCLTFRETQAEVERLGVPSRAIVKVGMVSADRGKTDAAASRVAARSSLGASEATTIVAYPAARRPIATDTLTRTFGQLGERAMLVVRPHPSDTRDRFAGLSRSIPNIRITDTKRDLRELLFASDVVLTGYSAVILEALLLGKFVILDQVDPQSRFSVNRGSPLSALRASGLVPFAYSDDELHGHLISACADSTMRMAFGQRVAEWLRSEDLVADGGTSRRLVKAALELRALRP